MAEYGSVTDLLKNKNPVKKDCKVSENPSPILSSIWNELVGKISKVLQFLASLKPSSSFYLVNLLVGVVLLSANMVHKPKYTSILDQEEPPNS